MKIVIAFRCTWCRRLKTATIIVTNPKPDDETLVFADDYRTCEPCTQRVWSRNVAQTALSRTK